MLNAITEKKPFVLGTRYGPGVEMDKDVWLIWGSQLILVAYASSCYFYWRKNARSSIDYSLRSHVRILWNSQEICILSLISLLTIVWTSLRYQSPRLQSCPRSTIEISPSSQWGNRNSLFFWDAQRRGIEAYRQSHVEILGTIGRIVLVEVCWTDYYPFGCICAVFWDCGNTDLGEQGQT